MIECIECKEQRLASTVCMLRREELCKTEHTHTHTTPQILAGSGLEVSPADAWEELWPNLTSTVGQEAASALLVKLGCLLDESDIQDAGEKFLEDQDAKCAEWLDKFIKVCRAPPRTHLQHGHHQYHNTQTVMYIHFNKKSSEQ